MAVNRPRRTFRGSAVVCACRDTAASATETIRIERNFTASTLAASESDARHKLAGTRRADPARVQSPKAADRQRLRQGDIASGRHRKHGPVKDVEEFRPYLEAEPLAIFEGFRAAEPRPRKLSEIAAALPEHSPATIDPDFAADVQDFIDRPSSACTLK